MYCSLLFSFNFFLLILDKLSLVLYIEGDRFTFIIILWTRLANHFIHANLVANEFRIYKSVELTGRCNVYTDWPQMQRDYGEVAYIDFM